MTQPTAAPLLSILIPTKDRYPTLVAVVGEITAQIGDHRLEIVICDNSVVPDTAQIARLRASDARLSYYHSGDEISIVENTERGIALCRGDYLCFIGDDDLVSPHIMAIVDWLQDQDGDCLIYPPARYWWSSAIFPKESRFQRPGVFWLPRHREGTVRQHDSAEELNAVLARGGVTYMNLPRLYHGIASRRALERVGNRFGCYVPGSSPDMALCMALALTTTSYLSIDYPVTVSGASRNSGAGLTAARKHYGRIEDQRMLPRDILDNWDPRLPKFWSEQIIYPQTIHEIFSRVGQPSTISYSAMYSSLVVYEPHIIRHLLPILAKHVAGRSLRLTSLLGKIALKIAGRIRVFIRNKTGFGMPFDLHSFPDIAAVMAFMANLPPPAVTTEESRG